VTVRTRIGALVLAAALCGAACGSKEPAFVIAELPEYSQQEASAFDDSFAPEVFDPEASAPKGERFEENVQQADLIVPARLTAINAKRSEGSVRYQMIADPSGTPLKGVLGQGALEFEISPGSPSLGMLKALDTQLVGIKLILLVRRYQADGKMVMHFRAEADTVPSREAITMALRAPAPVATGASAPWRPAEEKVMLLRTRSVRVKSAEEIELMRTVCRLAADTLCRVADILRPGISTEEINTFVHADTLAKGAIPAPLNYNGFPKSVCTSINEVVCHGIPSSDEILQDGDIINVDVTHIYEGFHGDTSATFYIGTPSDDAKRVTEVSRRCLELAIAEVRPGGRLGDIGAVIEEFALANRCSVVRDFVGHGIGRKFHEDPKVSHVGKRGRGERIRAGMTFTIEPMINIGGYDVQVLDDDWTAVTVDGSLSAQFEHTILVTDDGCEVLTARDRPLPKSEIFPSYFG
jgi:methionyl aminopeptidase